MLGTFGSELVFFAGLEQEKNTLEALTSIVSCSKEAMSLGPCKPIVIREKVLPHLGFDTSASPKTAHAADSLFYIDQQSRIVRVQMK